MKRINNFFIFLVCCLPVLVFPAAPTTAEDENQLTFAADPWCPYNCEPDSDHPGYLVELASEVFEQYNYSIKYINLPWRRALSHTKRGIVDGALGAVRGNLDGNIVGHHILGIDETVLIVRKGEGFKYLGTSSLDGKKLGIITNYTYDNNGEIDQYIAIKKKGSVHVLHQESALDSLFKMLLKERIDVFLENKFVAQYKAKQMNLSNKIQIIETGTGDEIFIAFTPNDKGKKLAKLLDEGIVQLRNSGRLTQILDKYGLDDF